MRSLLIITCISLLSFQLMSQDVQDEPGKYRGHDYDYYHMKYKGATQQWGLGIALAITGAAANITSIVLATDNNYRNDGTGVILNVYGIIAFNIGVPLWISGGIKRANNRQAMKKARANTASIRSLKFGTTSHGLVLCFSF